MLAYQFRPIDQWPGNQTASRKKSPFSAGWTSTLDLLERELRHIAGREIVIQADVDLSMIRNDGMLRADAKPRSPRIILSFESKHGALSYPCDRYTHWQANVRAIALSLEALRTVDRYGVTRQAEQYKGWARLPPPRGEQIEIKLVHEAAAELTGVAGGSIVDVMSSRDCMERKYRTACATTHPDHHPEHANKFGRIQAAKQVLDAHFRVAGLKRSQTQRNN